MMDERELRARVTTPHDLHAAEVDAWERLSSAVPALASPFQSVHYARAVAESGMQVRVCVIYRGDAIVGFLPYQFRSRFQALAGAAEPVGGEMSDYFGLVAAPELRIAPRGLLRLARISYLYFSHLDETQFAYGLTGVQPRTGLRIRLGREHLLQEGAAESANRKYLKDTERRVRQLAKDVGEIDFSFDVQDGRSALLDSLIASKRMQYRRTNMPDALADAWKTRLLHLLSESRHTSCRGVLSVMSAGSRWVASHFGIMGNGMLQYWLPVYNPDLAKYAPGRLLIHRIIDSAPAAAIHTIDRGEGDTPSKRELANEEHRFFRGAWEAKSISGLFAHGLQSIKWRLG